jgi:hypothetical protein
MPAPRPLIAGLLAVLVTAAAAQAPKPVIYPPANDGAPLKSNTLQTPSAGDLDGEGDELGAIDRAIARQYERPPASQAAVINLIRNAQQEQQKNPQYFNGLAPASVSRWTSLGPSGDQVIENGSYKLNVVDTGRLQKVLPHPTNPNIIYALSSGGGLWVSYNYQAASPTWAPLTDRLGTTSGGNVAFGRAPSTIYLGLGDPFDAPGGVVLKTTNSGFTWSAPVALTNGAYSSTRVMDIAVDTSAAQDIVLVGTDGGLYRSIDGGTTYALVPLPGSPGNSMVWSLAKTSAGWLASIQAIGSQAVGAAGANAIYLSSDRGATWSKQGGLTPAGAAGRATLAVGAPGDSVVYAFAANQAMTSQYDLYRSNDGGVTFSALGLGSKVPSTPTSDQQNMNVMNGQAWYNQMVMVDPSDATRNTVYIGGNLCSAKSTDGGNSWSLTSHWLAFNNLPYVHADFHTSAATLIGGKATLFVGTDGGLFSSTDGGNSWNNSKQRGITTSLIYGLSVSPNHNDQILVGLQDDGTRFHEGGFKNFNQVLGGDGFSTAWSQANDNVSLATLYYSRIYACYNNPPATQNCWQWGSTGLSDYAFNFHTNVAMPPAASDPSGQVFFHTSGTRAWKTTNGAHSWTLIGPASNGSIGLRDVPHNIGFSKSLKSIGVAATAGRASVTLDSGAHWTTVVVNNEVPGFASFTNNVTFTDDNTVFVTSVNNTPGVVHVAKSSQGGAHATWSASQSGLPDVAVNRLLADFTDSTAKTVYAATDLGVYISKDSGSNWTLLGIGLPQMRVDDLYLSPDGKTLYAGTYGRGAWSIKVK